MILYVKNMVCNRCKMVVTAALVNAGIKPLVVELGEITLENNLSEAETKRVDTALRLLGFEIIDDKKSRIIEQVKNLIIDLIHHSETYEQHKNLSALIAQKLNYDYNYLSTLFSEVEGRTIENYFITQRIEKVKELLMYDELTLSEIADRLGYSSVAYLSNQFKKVTGLTPGFYKGKRYAARKNLDEL